MLTEKKLKNFFSALTKIEIVVQGTYGFLHDVYSKQLYSMKGYRYSDMWSSCCSIHLRQSPIDTTLTCDCGRSNNGVF
jgi:hypothetical protein